MNTMNQLAKVKADSAVRELKRRESLLKIIRGKPRWIYSVLGLLWIIGILCIERMGIADNAAIPVLLPLGIMFIGVYLDFSRRMNALLDLIGEENLKNGKTSVVKGSVGSIDTNSAAGT